MCNMLILWSKVGKAAEKNFWKRQIYKILDKIPEKNIFHYYHGMIFNANRKKTRMVRILTFPTPNSEYGYYRNWYENSADTEFEGKVFRGIKDYDSYLTFKFGDYMQLPPESERKVHPVSKIRLDKESGDR